MFNACERTKDRGRSAVHQLFEIVCFTSRNNNTVYWRYHFQKKTTKMRLAIAVKDRVVVTLRFLASGM